MRLVQHGERDAEPVIGLGRPGDGLEHQIDRRARLDRRDRCRDMAEAAMLRGNVELRADRLQHLADADVVLQRVGRRVHADHRVARAMQQAVQRRECDAPAVIGGVVGLVAGGDAALQPDGGAEAGHDADLAGNRDQVLHAHDLRDTAATISGVRPGARAARASASVSGASSQSRNPPTVRCATGAKAALSQAVEDQRGDVIALDLQHVSGKLGQRQIGQPHLRSQPFDRAVGGKARQLVAAAFRRWPWRAVSSGTESENAFPVDRCHIPCHYYSRAAARSNINRSAPGHVAQKM
jgi:hypothetical protein